MSSEQVLRPDRREAVRQVMVTHGASREQAGHMWITAHVSHHGNQSPSLAYTMSCYTPAHKQATIIWLLIMSAAVLTTNQWSEHFYDWLRNYRIYSGQQCNQTVWQIQQWQQASRSAHYTLALLSWGDNMCIQRLARWYTPYRSTLPSTLSESATTQFQCSKWLPWQPTGVQRRRTA